MANATATELQQLYIAYFGRAADPTGLDYWTDAGTTTKAFAASMHAQAEFKSVYGSLSTEAQVNQIYINLFDRDADASGLLYWTKQIKSGALELASIANDLIWAANNNSGSAADKKTLDNKTSAAEAYTTEVKKTTEAILAYAAASTDPFVAGANFAEAKTYIASVDGSTPYTAAGVTASVSTITSNGVQTGNTYTLTSDSPSITEGDSGTKTLAFTVTLDKAATSDTTVNYETLTTGTATAGDDFVATSGTVSFVTGQKTASVNVTVNNDTTYENDGTAETVKIKFSGSSLTADVTATGSITENDSAPATATTYTLTSDSPSITEGDTETKTLAFTVTLDKAATADTTVNYETLTTGTATAGDDFVAKAGTVTIAAGQKTATVNVTVNNDTTYENDGTAETVKIKFSGSSLTADVTATGSIKENDSDPDLAAQALTLTTGVDALTGKKGNDTFDGSTAGSLDTADEIDGGEGTDTLSATVGNESIRPTVKNVEKFNFTANDDTLNIDARDITGVTEFTNESSVGKSAINNLGYIPTFNINSASSSADQTINFTDAALAGSADELKINLNNFIGTSDIVVTDGGGTTNKLETITINSTSLESTVSVFTTDDVDATTLKITGDEKLTIGGSISTDFTTVNASDFTADLSVTGANTTAVNITGGSGNDTLTSVGGSETLDGGAGNDTLSPGTGTDTVKGGAGNDTFQFSATTDLTSADTIAGGEGTDTIKYITATDFDPADADFTNVTSVEVMTAGTNINIDAVLGAKAAASGLQEIVLTDTGAANTVTIGSAFTSDLAVTLSSDGTAADSVAANADYDKALTVTGLSSNMDNNANTVTGGKGTSDVLTIKFDATDSANVNSVSNVETINITDGDTDTDTANTVTLADANATYTSATDYQTLTIDSTTIGASSDTVVVDAALEVDGKVIIKTGASADTITADASANFGSDITTGAGNDTVNIATGAFTSADSIDAGDGTDTLAVTNDATVVDADFTNVKNFETLSGASTVSLNATLEDLADAAGIRTVTLLDAAEAEDSVTIGADFTSALTINLDDSANHKNTVDASAYVGAGLTVVTTTTKMDVQSSADTITGSAGTDIYEIQTDNAASSAVSTSVNTGITKFEQFKITDGDTDVNATFTFVLADQAVVHTNTSTYETITIDSTAIGASSDTINVNAATENDSKVVIKTGDGVNTITLSTSANHGDTVTAGAGNDTIVAADTNLTSIDSIDGGTGDDTINFNADATVLDAAFTGVSNVKTIGGTATTVELQTTLGAQAAEAGISAYNFTGVQGAEVLTIGAGFTNDLTIDLDSDAKKNTVTATNYTKNLTVNALDTEIEADGNTVLTGGTGTNDTVAITIAGTADDVLEVDGITGFETISLAEGGTGANAFTVTVLDAMVADGKTLHIDASGFSTDTLVHDASAEADGVNKATGGGGADTFVASISDQGDTLKGGAGNDTFTFDQDYLTSADTIAGGAGTDSLILSDDSTATVSVVDADFTNVTSVETISHANKSVTITLGALAQAAGVVTLTGGSATNTTTIGSGYTSNISITGAGSDVLTATDYTGTLTYTGDIDIITSADTLTAGSGTSDELKLSLNGTNDDTTAAEMINVTGFEKLTISSDDEVDITLSENNVADGKSMTVNATAITTQVFTFDGSAESDGTYTITAGGTGAHVITLGQLNDTLTSTSTGNHTVTATSGDNTITTGDGADTITGGTGDDTIKSGGAADIIKFTSANLTSGDTVDGGLGTDVIHLTTDGSVVVDSDFTNFSNVEHVTIDDNSILTLTLGKEASDAGVVTVTLTDDSANGLDTITVGSGFANNLTVNLDGDAVIDTINAANYTKDLKVVADAAGDLVNVAHVLTGGSGTDELEYTAIASETIQLDSMTKFETITLKTDTLADHTTTLTMADATNASAAITVDATAYDGDNLIFSAANEDDGTYTVKTAGGGAMSITLGSKNDTLDATNGTGTDASGVHTVTATGGNNTITTGSAADIITAGSGTDTIKGGGAADTFIFGSVTNAAGDSLSDWASTSDKIRLTLDYSSSVGGVNVTTTRTSAGVAGLATAEATFSGLRGQFVYDTTNSNLLVDVTGDGSIGNADYKISLKDAATAANTVVQADLQFVINGGTGDDTITSGTGVDTIDAGTGADTIDPGADALIDTISFTAGDSVTTVAGTSGNGTITGYDVIADNFDDGDGTNKSDVLNLETGTTAVATNTAAKDGIDSTLKMSNGAVIKSHLISSGIIKFDDHDTYDNGSSGDVTLTTINDAAAAIQYLQLNDFGDAGATLAFDVGSDTWLFMQGHADGANSLDVVVKIVGEQSTAVSTTNASTAHLLAIA